VHGMCGAASDNCRGPVRVILAIARPSVFGANQTHVALADGLARLRGARFTLRRLTFGRSGASLRCAGGESVGENDGGR
jgi:hypothetical protein